jgi:hypothetical protein
VARVLEVLALDWAEGSSKDSMLGLRADIGMVGIKMSHSNLAMGEMKLSKFCIQVIGI